MEELARRETQRDPRQAGTKLNGSLLQAGVVTSCWSTLLPADRRLGRGMFHLPVLTELSRSRQLKNREVESVGEDLRILARFEAAGTGCSSHPVSPPDAT